MWHVVVGLGVQHASTVVQTTGLQQQLVMLVEVRVTVVVGTVVLVVDVTGKKEVLVTIKVSVSVSVSKIVSVSVTTTVSVVLIESVTVVKGPVVTVEVVTMAGPKRQRAHGALSHSIGLMSLMLSPRSSGP